MMEPTPYRFDAFVIDPLHFRLTENGEPRPMEPKTFRLLQYLVDNRQRVVPKEELIRVVWEGAAVTDNALTRAVGQIRKALRDDPKQPRYIETVPTVGYRFLAAAPAAAPEAPAERKAVAPPRGRVAWYAALTGAVAAVVGAVYLRPAATTPRPAITRPVPLTTYPGLEVTPDFSPDGNQVAFSWNGPGEDNFDIYVKALGSETPLRLTTAGEQDLWPRWAPDGRLVAFQRILPGNRIAVLLIPALGGPERKLAEFISHRGEAFSGEVFLRAGMGWSPDGKWLAVSAGQGASGPDRITLVSVETGEVRAVTAPGADTIGDFDPAFSPDGAQLLFRRSGNDRMPGGLYTLPLGAGATPAGEPRRVTEDTRRAYSAQWTEDGKAIIYASGTNGDIYRVAAAGGTPVRLDIATVVMGHASLSRDGRRLAFATGTKDSNIWRLDLTAKDPKAERLIASTYREVSPQYSPDGRRIVFTSTRSGSSQIWVCDADGSRAGKLTSMPPSVTASPRWSPDGRQIAFDSDASGSFEVYVVNADGGRVRQLTGGATSNFAPSWSKDGKSVYFASKRSGQHEVWKIPAVGGEAVQVTRNGGMAAVESADGKTLYFNKPAGAGSLWKMPVDGGGETQLADALYRFNFAVGRTGLYFMSGPAVEFVDTNGGARRRISTTRTPDLGIALSPDGRYLLYAQTDAMGTDLMMVEGLR